MTKAELLLAFASKAGCMHSQQRAEQLWAQLRPMLTRQEQIDLSGAWWHHTDVRLGRGELDRTVVRLLASWKGSGPAVVSCRCGEDRF